VEQAEVTKKDGVQAHAVIEKTIKEKAKII